MQTLKHDSASTEPHVGMRTSPENAGIAREQRIANPVESILVRLRKLLDKVAEGDLRIAWMQRELHQLQREKVVLTTQLEEISRKHGESTQEALHDALTGLPNRKRLRDRFDIAIGDGHGHGRHDQIVLMFLDLDNFKQVNDEFGHSVGDKILQVVAARLQASIRATDTACRYGGDEFVILLTHVDSTTGSAELATHICDRLAEQYQVCGTDINLQASVGTATYPDDCQNWEELVHRADTEMYRSRARSRQSNSREGVQSV